MFNQKVLVSVEKNQPWYTIRYTEWNEKDVEIMKVQGLQNSVKKLKSSNLNSHYDYMLVSNFLDGEKKRFNSVEKHAIRNVLQS